MNEFYLYTLISFRTDRNGSLLDEKHLGIYTLDAIRRTIEARGLVAVEKDNEYNEAAYYAINSISGHITPVMQEKDVERNDWFSELGWDEPKKEGYDKEYYVVSKRRIHGSISEINENDTFDSIVYL